MPVLELRGVTKSFGAIHALNGVDLAIERGEAIGLMVTTAPASRR